MRAGDPRLRALAAKVAYDVDPANDYPRSYSGHLWVGFNDGHTLEAEQPHLRGGRKAPLSRDQLLERMRANLAHGGWPEARAAAVDAVSRSLFDSDNMAALRSLRS